MLQGSGGCCAHCGRDRAPPVGHWWEWATTEGNSRPVDPGGSGTEPLTRGARIGVPDTQRCCVLLTLTGTTGGQVPRVYLQDCH
jgi:hypothetical protein